MKLIRFGEVGKEKPGIILANGTKIDVSDFGSDYDEFFFGDDEMKGFQRNDICK